MRAAVAAAIVLAAGCGGGPDGLRVALEDADPLGERWTIRAACEGRHFSVEFRPGDRISVSEIGHASYEEISVECGKPERVAITHEEGAPTVPDMTDPTDAATKLACFADGTLIVSVNPIWGERSITGSSVMIERGGQAIVAGSLKRDERTETDESSLSWSRGVCEAA